MQGNTVQGIIMQGDVVWCSVQSIRAVLTDHDELSLIFKRCERCVGCAGMSSTMYQHVEHIIDRA